MFYYAIQNRFVYIVNPHSNNFRDLIVIKFLNVIIPAACVWMILVITVFKHSVSLGLHCGSAVAERILNKRIVKTKKYNNHRIKYVISIDLECVFFSLNSNMIGHF